MTSNSEVDLDTDLPLRSNFEAVHTTHYAGDLFCDFQKNAFVGHIEVDLAWKKSEVNVVVLDSCDLIVSKVLAINTCDTEKVNNKQASVSLNPENTPNVKNIDQIQDGHADKEAENAELEFTVSDWSLDINCGQRKADRIRIYYKTLPGSRSLLWRRDPDGAPCVYTAAAGVNNRGLFPCQDLPGSMSTWSMTIRMPASTTASVFTTGDFHAMVTSTDQERSYAFHTSMLLPMSTFAIAIGTWNMLDLSTSNISQSACLNYRSAHNKSTLVQPESNTNLHQSQNSANDEMLPIRLIGPKSLLCANAAEMLKAYIPAAVSAATKVLGPYPLPKADFLIVSRNFSGLGLASPNLTFLSPSLVTTDLSSLVKVAHEVCHAWFGILLGATDWTEAWLSEGFATFLEDFVHRGALDYLGYSQLGVGVSLGYSQLGVGVSLGYSQLGVGVSLVKLRGLLKLKTLQEELGNTVSSLQTLRPMQGKPLMLHSSASSQSEGSYVKHGLNPEAGLTQSHYLKGFFLLHYLMEQMGSEEKFLQLIVAYFDKYRGELVDSYAFLFLFYDKYSSAVQYSIDQLVHNWLDSPGLPDDLTNLSICNPRGHLYDDVMDFTREILRLNSSCNIKKKNSTRDSELYCADIQYTEQVRLVLETLTDQQPRLHRDSMSLLEQKLGAFIAANLDARHGWCELILRGKHRGRYHQVTELLREHQCMGVYLYSELLNSNNKIQTKLGRKTFRELEPELDPSTAVVIRSYLPSSAREEHRAAMSTISATESATKATAVTTSTKSATKTTEVTTSQKSTKITTAVRTSTNLATETTAATETTKKELKPLIRENR